MRIVSAVLAAVSAVADVKEFDPCPPRMSSAMQEGACWLQQS